MPGDTRRRYPPELKQRAVRMATETRREDETEWAAMRAVSALPSLLNEFSCGGTSRMAKLTVPPSVRFRKQSGK